MKLDFLEQINWDANGLIPVITQDSENQRVLTLAWLNSEALSLAVKESRAIYWSRSRQAIWRKGEQSGNIQELVGVYLDCDNDCICYKVKQIGGIACHTGRESCFYQKLVDGDWTVVDPVIKDPEEMYAK